MLVLATSSISFFVFSGSILILFGTGVVIVSPTDYKPKKWTDKRANAIGTMFIGLGTVITFLGITENAHVVEVTILRCGCALLALTVIIVIWLTKNKSDKPEAEKEPTTAGDS